MATPVLMFMNMKGGVGKTTLAIEIGRALAFHCDKHILLIDYDPQANASFALLGTKKFYSQLDQGKSITNILMPDLKPGDPFKVIGMLSTNPVDVRKLATRWRYWYYPADPDKKAGSFWLIPGNLELLRIALNQLSVGSENRLLSRWNKLMESSKRHFDCVIIDCHPAGSFLTKSALLSSDAVIIPVTTDGYAAIGLGMMRTFMERWSSSGGAMNFTVIFNDPQKSWDDAIENDIRSDKRFAKHCLNNTVPYSKLFRNLVKRHQAVSEQPLPHRRKLGYLVSVVTSELVEQLKRQGVLDTSWSFK